MAKQDGAEAIMLAPNTPMLDKALEVVNANSQKLPILGGDAVLQAKTREMAGKNALGMIIASPWNSLDNSQSNFLRRARSLWGEEISWRTALAYDATQALITATDNNFTRVGVQQALTALSFTANGASGTVKFLPSGDRITNVELVHLISDPNAKYGYNFVPMNY